MPPWAVLALAGGLLAVIVIVIAVVNTSGHTMAGSMTVYDDAGCDLSLGYTDIREGTRVYVTDEDDEVVASSSLEDGDGGYGYCEFPFTIEDVPNRDDYWVEVGDRGEVHFTREDLEDDAWNVEVSLGQG